MHYRATLKPLGYLLWVLAASQLFPLALALAENQGTYSTARGFLTSIAASLILGTILWLAGRRSEAQLHRKEGLFIVAFTWLLGGLLGSLPFVLSGAIPSPLDAIFESVSGFTTTGASILTDIEVLPRSILLWRSLTHWLGGGGIVILFVAILPSLGIGGKHLYRIEATGPTVTGLQSRAVDTARTLWLIYTSISVLEFLFLWLGGMPVFDAVCHTFGTVATGGFSTKNASIAYYGTYFQVVITIFMFMCGVNFSLYYQWVKRKFLVFRDSEFKLYACIFLLGVVCLFTGQFATGSASFWTALRESTFVVASISTSTGYVTADYEQWPVFSQGFLVLLMFFGASAGSTSGGMKVVRLLILVRMGLRMAVQAFRPSSVLPLRLGGVPIDREIEEQVAGFALLYMGWVVAGTMVLMLFGHDLVTSFVAPLTCIANIGPGLGLVGPTDNYAAIHPVAKGFLALLMVVGRLEVMAITVLFVPSFWRR